MKEVLKNTLNLDLIHDLGTINMDDTKLNISVAGFGGLSEPDDSRSFLGHKFTQALSSNMIYTWLLFLKEKVFGK